MSFSEFEYAGKRKQTRRERFLAEMDQVVPSTGSVAVENLTHWRPCCAFTCCKIGRYNEIRIEDQKGQEEIYLHAQRDWDENIENDQVIRVGNE
jgi:hypothetical protein